VINTIWAEVSIQFTELPFLTFPKQKQNMLFHSHFTAPPAIVHENIQQNRIRIRTDIVPDNLSKLYLSFGKDSFRI